MGLKAYKGFNKDMTCRGFQFQEGETYEEPEAKLCTSGFHACLNPLDCLKYYSPVKSEFHEVDLDDVSNERGDDTKVCAKKIKIGAKIDIANIVSIAVDFVKTHCIKENTSGDYGVSAGCNNSANTSGDYGVSAGRNNSANTSGDLGVSAGCNNSANTSGDYGVSAGCNNSANTSGDFGVSAGRGISASGRNGLSVSRGNDAKAKGGLGSVIVIVNENDYDYDIAEWKAGVIDGENMKPDTWYKLENGEFVECEE